jgi:hypothetical protein
VEIVLLFFNALNLVDNQRFLSGFTETVGFTENKGIYRSLLVHSSYNNTNNNTNNNQSPVIYQVPCNGTAFDVIVETARIFTFHGSRPPQQPRREAFDVDAWKHKGTGGLTDDKDRAMLGRMYGNAQSVFEYGLGESTRIADAVGVPRYAGLDSDTPTTPPTRGRRWPPTSASTLGTSAGPGPGGTPGRI